MDPYRRVEVVDPDPAWPGAFAAEAARIRAALGPVYVEIHHIGSTSVPELAAKPVIDMLLEVDGLAELDGATGAMAELGYEGLGEFGLERRRYFRKDSAAGVRTHQVHAYAADDPSLERHLAFRDFLRAHPADAQAYGELKRRLALAHPEDIEAYMAGKDDFIKTVERRGIAWARALEGR